MTTQEMIRLEAEVRAWTQTNEWTCVRRHIDAALGTEDGNPDAVCETIITLVRKHLREYLKGKREL